MISFRPYPGVLGGFLGLDASDLEKHGLRTEDFYQVKQVHGDAVRFLRGDESIAGLAVEEADALVTSAGSIPMAVRTADCVPILIAHAEGPVAAVHAGWKGTSLRILAKTLRLMVERYVLQPGGFRISIGPAICGSCYEVGSEVAERFRAAPEGALTPAVSEGKWLLDLKRVNFSQAEGEGVPAAQIQVIGDCTRCLPQRYHSFRRMSAQGVPTAGRNYSWIRRG